MSESEGIWVTFSALCDNFWMTPYDLPYHLPYQLFGEYIEGATVACMMFLLSDCKMLQGSIPPRKRKMSSGSESSSYAPKTKVLR